MNHKKQFARNKLFNFAVIGDLFFSYGSIACLTDSEILGTVIFGILALGCIAVTVLTPAFYLFDAQGVSLYYLFLPRERYLWKDIRAITVEDKTISSRPDLLDFIYCSVFELDGMPVGKQRFYMKGHIRKSFRTKRLLEKYWDGTITGYLLEDVKKWISNRKAKKQQHIQEHLTDEIVPMEREIRAAVREWLVPLTAQARARGLEVKTKYLYITEDWEESRSRPKTGYTYTLSAEISLPNETNEDRIVTVDTDLLYVRLGKTAYRGVVNKFWKEEMQALLTIPEEISKVGIDAYCADV